jgi:hypothetical protein
MVLVEIHGDPCRISVIPKRPRDIATIRIESMTSRVVQEAKGKG